MESHGQTASERMPGSAREMVPAEQLETRDELTKEAYWQQLIAKTKASLDNLPALGLRGVMEGVGVTAFRVSVRDPKLPRSYTYVSVWRLKDFIWCDPLEGKPYDLRYIAQSKDASFVDERGSEWGMSPEQACGRILQPLIQAAQDASK